MIDNLTEQYASFINQYHWDWYAMLTFRNKISPHQAWHLFNYWKIDLKHATGNPITYLYVRELPNWSYHPHLHVLLSGTGNEKIRLWEKRWYQLAGIADIKPYNPELGASYYLAGKLADDVADWKFSKNLMLPENALLEPQNVIFNNTIEN